MRSYDGTHDYVKGFVNGSTELYYDNVKKLETTADGIKSYGTNLIRGAEGGTAQIRLEADEGDDNADKWRFVANTDGTFGIQNFASGSYENSIKATGDGNVELYHNNNRKFYTISSGTITSGHSYLLDNNKVILGSSDDLQIYHDGSDSFIKNDSNIGWLRINSGASGSRGTIFKNNSNDEEYARMTSNGSVELYYDNVKKLETHASNGVQFPGGLQAPDTQALRLGSSNDLLLYHDGSHSYIANATGSLRLYSGGAEAIRCTDAKAVELYHDGSLRLSTASGGVSFTNGHLTGGDNNRLRLGASADLDLWHDGSNSFIQNNTADFNIQANALYLRNGDGDETYAKCVDNGAVELYYDNTKRFETNSTGAHCTGKLVTSSDGAGSAYYAPSAFLAYSSNSSDANVAEIFQGRYNRTNLCLSHANTGSVTFMKFNQSDALKGTITGDNTNVAYNTSGSDRTLKKNFEDWTDSYWTGFKNLKPQKFHFLTQEDSGPKTRGYIAQDLVSTFPEAYPKSIDTDKYMFNPSGMVIYLMKTLQEAITKIETLETEVAALKAK